jgi:hypothetical protein
MLRAKAWARILSVAEGILAYLFGLVSSPGKLTMPPGVAVLVVAAFFLFRRNSNEYFSGASSPPQSS